MDSLIFRKRLKKLRTDNFLTQEQLGSKLYVSKKTISKWETGRGFPDIAMCQELSKLFGVSVDFLFNEEEKASNGAKDVTKKENLPKEESYYSLLNKKLEDAKIKQKNASELFRYKSVAFLLACALVILSGLFTFFYIKQARNLQSIPQYTSKLELYYRDYSEDATNDRKYTKVDMTGSKDSFVISADKSESVIGLYLDKQIYDNKGKWLRTEVIPLEHWWRNDDMAESIPIFEEMPIAYYFNMLFVNDNNNSNFSHYRNITTCRRGGEHWFKVGRDKCYVVINKAMDTRKEIRAELIIDGKPASIGASRICETSAPPIIKIYDGETLICASNRNSGNDGRIQILWKNEDVNAWVSDASSKDFSDGVYSLKVEYHSSANYKGFTSSFYLV